MAVCNIFNRIKNTTGTFLMFSQYVEDLTRESTQSVYYRITPSKFIASELNFKDHNNDSIPRDLQNKFENGCAVCRKEMENSWVPTNSSNIFWHALFDMGLLSLSENNTINEIKYVGDINLQSYNEHDGVGYSEIYCYIPNESKQYNYSCIIGEDSSVFESGDVIEGYKADDLDAWTVIGDKLYYYPDKFYNFSWEDDILDTKELNTNKYDINSIIVLYDIKTKTETGAEILYKNIPMGIYFTGLIDDDVMSNKITKYIYNEDIFGAGTSYGLRICTRFTVTPNQDNIKVLDVTVDNDNYSAISQVMSQLSISQNKMDEILTKVQANTSAEKELLAIFKNSRTNVPYVKNINGTSYWFVNGRNVGSILGDIEYEYIPYEKEEILEMLRKTASLFVKIMASDDEGNTIFDLSENEKSNIIVQWEVLFNNTETIPDELTINNIHFETNITNTIMSDVNETTVYSINAKKEGLSADASATVYFVYPTYFGTLPDDHTCGDDYIHNFNPEEEEIKKLTKYINISRKHEYEYSNVAKENGNIDHVVLAYPKMFESAMSILDAYNYDYLEDFHVYEKTFTFNGTPVEYLVYVDKTPAEVTDFKLKFT